MLSVSFRRLARAGLMLAPFLALLAQNGFREFPYEETNPAPVPAELEIRLGHRFP